MSVTASFEVFQDADELWYFALVPTDGDPIAVNPTGFDTEEEATAAAGAAKEAAGEADILRNAERDVEAP